MRLPSPQELKVLLPLSSSQQRFVLSSRQQIKDILLQKDQRIAIIAGPCSIHDLTAAKEYAIKFKQLAAKVEQSCLLVMRVFAEKPRTTLGWKGFLYDPHLNGTNDIGTGLYLTRKLLLNLADLEIPIATEFVDPLTAAYLQDAVAWGFIGARTSASQPHRQLASHLDMPFGFKNSTDGDLDDAINGIIAARAAQSLLFIDDSGKICEMKSQGNTQTHIVLRGSNLKTNFDASSVSTAFEKLRHAGLPPRILIDCSHGNCQKDFHRQKEAFYTILDQINEGTKEIIGVMLESHLQQGNQLLSEGALPLRYGVSITDPCIDWATTEELVLCADAALDRCARCI